MSFEIVLLVVASVVTNPFDLDFDRWSFNYFFFNKKMKRIIYFTMRGVRYLSLIRLLLGYTFILLLMTDTAILLLLLPVNSYGAPSEDDGFSDMSDDDIGFAPQRRR